MKTLAEIEKMLICPKCQKTYKDGTQRFCLNDGVRLNPQNAAHNSASPAGVFSGVLKKSAVAQDDAELEPIPVKLFREPFDRSELVNKGASRNLKTEPPQTFTKLVKPEEIPSGQAQLGDRRTNPVGRVALSAENPNILLGQTVKGRYFIKSRISQTAHGIKYLAADKLNGDKKVIVKIYTGRLDDSDFSAGIFADERVGLSHLNHPNAAKVFDSGELPEGNPFIVSDYINGIALKEGFTREPKFSALQAARIVRQAAGALSEAHRNGVLHRNLNPENVILSAVENGTEQVKVTDFNIFSGKSHGAFDYLAPEQINGGAVNSSTDVFSLGVIAYRMLTGRLPFAGSTPKELFKAQQKGLRASPTSQNAFIPEETDRVLRKALAFNPSERFQSVRDFGDSFYNSLIAGNENLTRPSSVTAIPAVTETDDFTVSLDSVLDEKPVLTESRNVDRAESPVQPVAVAPVSQITESAEKIEKPQIAAEAAPIAPGIEKPPRPIKFHRAEMTENPVAEKPSEKTEKAEKAEIPWERRSIEPPPQGGRKWTTLAIVGIGLLFALTALIFYLFANRPAEQPPIRTAAENQPAMTPEVQPKTEVPQNIIEIPPPARAVKQPEGTIYFENSKENLSKEMLKYFRGFSFYYPEDWKQNKFDKNRNKVEDKFVDISKTDADGIPLEQFMVSYYDSQGTFDLDRANFPAIVSKASEDIKNSPLPNFQLVGSGAINLNKKDDYEGWKSYEMKFQGEGTALSGEKIKLFGRRFYIPAARPGVKKGLVVTLLATSLSKDVQSANDLGEKGDLQKILSTFEPDQNF